MPITAGERRVAKRRSTDKARPARSPAANRGRNDAQIQDRRTQILAAAARLFAEYGFETTSVRQIADEVDILAGSLYHHFATKEDMLHEVIREPLREIVEDNLRIAQLPVDAECRLVTSIIVRFRQYIEDWPLHAILMQEGKFFRRSEDFTYVQEAKAQAFHLQEAILKEGMDAGLFHPGIDTYLMIGTIARMLSSAAAWFRSGDIYSSNMPERYTLDTVIDFHLDCILRMVRSSSRQAEPIPRETCDGLAELGLQPG